jgi:hypothetical protein
MVTTVRRSGRPAIWAGSWPSGMCWAPRACPVLRLPVGGPGRPVDADPGQFPLGVADLLCAVAEQGQRRAPGEQFTAAGTAELTVNGTPVRFLPDTRGGTKNEAKFRFVPDHLTTPGFTTAKGCCETITGPIPTAPVVEIFTNYADEGSGAAADPLTATSSYGRGTTASDKASHDTSLRFHESRHGEDILRYLAKHPFPTFTGRVNMTLRAFKTARSTFLTA